MHNNKITKVFALFISLVLVFAVVFSVAACSKKKSNKTIEKQTEQQVKGKTLDKLYEFMSIKNMEFDVKSEGKTYKTYAGEKYLYNSEKNEGFINFDSWVHDFKIENDELKIGRRAAKIMGFPHYRKGDTVRGQFFSIQASMTDKDMYTQAKVNAGGYEFTVDGNVASTTNHNVLESIANSLGSKIPYEELTKAVFTINGNTLNIKLMQDDKVAVEATMLKEEKTHPAVTNFLANNSEYKTDVTLDDNSEIIKKLKKLISDKAQAYKMHIKDYSHIIAGGTQEDVNSGNDWAVAKVKEHEIVQYFGDNSAFKFNSRTNDFHAYKKYLSSTFGVKGIFENREFKNFINTTDYEFASLNLIEKILSNMDKIKYLPKTDEYIFDYKEVADFEKLLEKVFEISNNNFFNKNKIDTVTLSVIDNKLCVNINRKIADNESLRKKISDNVVAIQAVIDFADKLEKVSDFSDAIDNAEKKYVEKEMAEVKNKATKLAQLIADEKITLDTDTQLKYDNLNEKLKENIIRYDQYKEIENYYNEVENLVYSKSKTILKKSIKHHIEDIKKIMTNNLDSSSDLTNILSKEDEYKNLIDDSMATVDSLQKARRELLDLLSKSMDKIKAELTQATQEKKNTELVKDNESLYTEDSTNDFKSKISELNEELNTVDSFIQRKQKLAETEGILRVLTRYEERELEAMKVWYSMSADAFVDEIRETIENATIAFNAIANSKRPMALKMIENLRRLYNNLTYLQTREKDDVEYNNLKNKLTELKNNAKYDTLSDDLKSKVDELLTIKILNLKDVLEVIEQMKKRINEIETQFVNNDKITEIKNKLSDFINNDTTNASEYSNGAEYKKLLDEVNDKKDKADYDTLVTYEILLNQAKSKLVKVSEKVTDETKKQNLKDLKEKFKMFYNGEISTVYEAEATDLINNNKQNLIYRHNKYVFNLATKKGIYKENDYKVNATLDDENRISQDGVNWFSNKVSDYLRHLKHHLDKSDFHINNTVLNGTGFLYLDELDDITIPDGFKGILSLLRYKNIDRIAVQNNSDNSLTFIGYRKVEGIDKNAGDFGYYEAFRMKATPTINDTLDKKILSEIEKNKAMSWEDIKNKLDNAYEITNGDGDDNSRYSYEKAQTAIGDVMFKQDGSTEYKLPNGEVIESSYKTKNSKLESIKNDISGIIRRIIDNSEDLENFEIETDDKNIITKFRDIFGIAKDEEESLSIRKIGNEILVKYENENSSYKFKIKIK